MSNVRGYAVTEVSSSRPDRTGPAPSYTYKKHIINYVWEHDCWVVMIGETIERSSSLQSLKQKIDDLPVPMLPKFKPFDGYVMLDDNTIRPAKFTSATRGQLRCRHKGRFGRSYELATVGYHQAFTLVPANTRLVGEIDELRKEIASLDESIDERNDTIDTLKNKLVRFVPPPEGYRDDD